MGVRFAPSPTGPFHIGNLRTAWISHQWSRLIGKPWVVRFEDIDGPRVVSGAQAQQLEDLRKLGLRPDQTLIQSQFHSRHYQLFLRALREGVIYPCYCSRREVQETVSSLASAPHGDAPLYSGNCRHLTSAPSKVLPNIGWRFRADQPDGTQDFLVARTSPPVSEAPPPVNDFHPSYHWACAIDDFEGHYDLLVRAWDLASATPIQRVIQKWLALQSGQAPRFSAVYHTALVCQDDGHRLEKRTQGVTLSELAAAGITPERLLKIFARSWSPPPETLKPALIFGEPKRELRLHDLLS